MSGSATVNATWIVDRLEDLGLAQRQPVLHDERVKLVVLTRKGRRPRGTARRISPAAAEFTELTARTSKRSIACSPD